MYFVLFLPDGPLDHGPSVPGRVAGGPGPEMSTVPYGFIQGPKKLWMNLFARATSTGPLIHVGRKTAHLTGLLARGQG